MSDGKVVKISQKAYERLVLLSVTELGHIPIGQVASNIIMKFNKKE